MSLQVKVFKTTWGMTGSMEEQLEKIAAGGYEGVEGPMPSVEQTPLFRNLLEQYKLEYIPMIYTYDIAGSHVESFRQQLERAMSFSPKKVNAHSGKDWMSFAEKIEYFEHALKIENELGAVVAHETHRGRATFAARETYELLQQLPELKLCADFSHWVVVSESLLEDQQQYLQLAMERTIHLHTRVGFAQGPQVPDPAAPEYANELEAHISWWEQIYRLHHARGEQEITIDPEFGPPAYLHTLPYTQQPVADLWDVTLWTAQLLRSRLANVKL
ncbi:sugar phosphate isomerase/epimerase family protein [Paenibacillus yanchengensis]|uniref:Sugar phosphate isomerase/epimerase family protein n=1 Tax=Paenibacillus yanchengensis TaxID=2035833 RepID=A0ABW4YLN5_9BACL